MRGDTTRLTNADVAAFAAAAGFDAGLAAARQYLQSLAPGLRARLLRACQTQRAPFHDPIEDETVLKRALAAAEDEARAIVGEGGHLGYCHALWGQKQRILRERFGITWFTPAEMNHGMVMFD